VFSGFSFCLIRCGAVVDDQEQSSWMRVTICWRKLDGRWQVAHEHYSEPFDMESGKALFDLKP
jgi:ketosteroid isomerase-like protein